MSVRREILTLHGRVQMVGYRECVIEIARRFAVAGTVRNLRSGQLEIDAEGEDEAVTAFLAAIVNERPQLARIDSAAHARPEPRGLASFERAPTA